MTVKNLNEMLIEKGVNISKGMLLLYLNAAVKRLNLRAKLNRKEITGSSTGTEDEQALVTTSETYDYSVPDDLMIATDVSINGMYVDSAWCIQQNASGKYLHFDLYQVSGYNIKIAYVASDDELTAFDDDIPHEDYWQFYFFYILSAFYAGLENSMSAAFNAKAMQELKEAMRENAVSGGTNFIKREEV